MLCFLQMNYFRSRFYFAVVLVFGVVVVDAASRDIPFDVNYNIVWGNDHVSFLDQGREAQLSMDVQSGFRAGFVSKLSYGSGFFHMKIKIPNKNSAGVVTAFYLSSKSNTHDELDFEFLGNREGKPITVQTNVFVNGQGDREQRIRLWFDPTADFHNYKILWNQYHIAFFIDDIPIRVFKNNTRIGVPYPTQAMQIEASLWNGDSWATDGGRTKTNWSNSPFVARFQDFNVGGCTLSEPSADVQKCYGSDYWWNESKYWKLDHKKMKKYEQVREKYMNYDYCSDRNRHPITPPECASNIQ